MLTSCQQVKKEYQDLATLKKEFDLELEKAAGPRAKELMAELIQRRDALQEKLWPFKELSQKELKEQRESQKEILQRAGILERLSTGDMGIKGIDNKEYAFPSYREIARGMRENKETLTIKAGQGFSQLLIAPFGMKLDDLIEKYKQVILKHHQEGKLLATKEKPSDPDELLELDESQPVWVQEGYKNADTSGKLVYFPESFTKNHHGKTKQQILKETKQGFTVFLSERLPNIPRAGKGKKIKGRKQLEADQAPSEYLKTLKTNPAHRNETGLTPEEWITYAIKHLEETNQVIDDYSGRGSASYQLGAYFLAGGNVPYAYWRRDERQAGLDWYDPEYPNFSAGARSAVRVKLT